MNSNKRINLNKEKKHAFDAACDYLSISERSTFEVRNKLKEKDYTDIEIEEAIEKLNVHGFLNDKNFAKHYVEYALAKGRGMRRIKDELRKKGIDSFDLEDVLYELEDEGIIDSADSKERALEQAMKALGNKIPEDKDIARIGRKLNTLGFSSDEIYFAVGKLMKLKKDGEAGEF